MRKVWDAYTGTRVTQGTLALDKEVSMHMENLKVT